MIVMQGINGQHFGGQSFGGLGAFTQGINYECGKTICYAKGKDNDAILKALQDALNRFAESIGFTPLYVDGFIGDLSVQAANAVLGANYTKETLTAAAPAVTSQLLTLAASSSLPPVAAPTAPTVAKTPVQKQEEAAAAASVGPQGGGHSWIWWLLGGVAVVGISTVGYMTYKRRKEGGMEMEAEPAMAGYRRRYR